MLYAKVKASQVVSVHRAGSPYIDENGTRYPSTIWSIPDWLSNNGCIAVTPYYYDDRRFYIFGASTYVYDEPNKAVNETVRRTDRSVSDIQKTLTGETLRGCKGALSGTNFYITRKDEDSDYSIPNDVATYRAAVYEHFDECNTAIDGASAHDECVSLMRVVTTDKDGKETATGTLWNWPTLEGY